MFALCLPVWLLVAYAHGLYAHDDERANHGTVDEISGVLHLVCIGGWIVFLGVTLTGLARPYPPKVAAFLVFATSFVILARGGARALSRRRPRPPQRTVIIGAGRGRPARRQEARRPPRVRRRRDRLRRQRSRAGRRRGSPGSRCSDRRDDLLAIVERWDVERVIVAFARNRPEQISALIAALEPTSVRSTSSRSSSTTSARPRSCTWSKGCRCWACRCARPTGSQRASSASTDVVVARTALDPAHPGPGRYRGPDQARLAGAGLLPPRARRPGLEAVPAVQVPDDVRAGQPRRGLRRRGGGAPLRGAHAGPAQPRGVRALVQAPQRSPHHPVRPRPAADVAGRAAAADQRRPGRHVARRPPAGDEGGARPLRRRGRRAPERAARA